MISKKLNKIFLLSLVLIGLHGLEEIMTGFQYQDSFMIFGGNLFSTKTEVFYWSSHMMFWLLLIISFLLIQGKKWVLRLMALFGLIFFVEIHHLIKAFLIGSYYPGMITAVFYPILGFFYWRQLLKEWKQIKEK